MLKKSDLFLLISLSLLLLRCDGQVMDRPASGISLSEKKVGGGCDGCELMYSGMPGEISSVDTSAGWSEKGQKFLITGTVYHLDGITPAEGVIIYYWQTDNNGYYSPGKGMDEKARRHGHIRGWVKTDKKGKYRIYTIRPAPYPGRDIPAHTHISLREPGIANEYYIDELVFDDDKLLTSEKRMAMENRGGSGVLRVLLADSLQVAEHDIILGLNVPNYPNPKITARKSGLPIGVDNPSFGPYHAFGADKGTRTCPVCKYGRYLGILYFVGNNPDWTDIKKWLKFFERESEIRGKFLKTYFVYGNEKEYSESANNEMLQNLGTELGLHKLALTHVPSFRNSETNVDLIKIDPEVKNTIVIYKQSRIVAKFIALDASQENFKKIEATLGRVENNFLMLPAIGAPN